MLKIKHRKIVIPQNTEIIRSTIPNLFENNDNIINLLLNHAWEAIKSNLVERSRIEIERKVYDYKSLPYTGQEFEQAKIPNYLPLLWNECKFVWKQTMHGLIKFLPNLNIVELVSTKKPHMSTHCQN